MTTAGLQKLLAPDQGQKLIELVDSQPSKFLEVLDIIKGMWDQKESFEGTSIHDGALERCISMLPIQQYISKEDRTEALKGKVSLLKHIGTDYAQQAVTELIADPNMNVELRLQIWKDLLGEATEFNLRCAVNTFSLVSKQSETLKISRPALRDIENEIYEALTSCAESEDNPHIKGVALNILYQLAEEGDIGILKYLFEMEAENSYQNALNILKKNIENFGLEEIGILISRGEYVPNAVKAFFEIATKTLDGCEVAEKALFRSDIPDDEQAPYQKMIHDARAIDFEAWKNFQQSGNHPRSYIPIARAFLVYFPEEAISMVGRQTLIKGKDGLTEGHVMAELTLLDSKTNGQYKHHLVNVLIARGTNEALCMATDILEATNPHPFYKDGEKAEREQQKKETIDGLSRVIGYHKKEKNAVAALCKFINSSNFATDETAKLAIMALANRGSSLACSALKSTLEGMAETGKQSFAFKALTGLESQNIFTYKCTRQIANMIGGEAIATALAHFKKDGSDDAVSQIHHLQLDQLNDPFAEIKKLPRPQAISELTGAFNRFACNAMNALMDLRGEALQSGTNDVADYDAALKQGVKHLFDNKALLVLIRKGGETQLRNMFVRLADTGVADKREQYNAALQVVTAEEKLAIANAQYQLSLKK